MLPEDCVTHWSRKPGRSAFRLYMLPKVLSQQHQDTQSAEGEVTGTLLASTANGHSWLNVNASAAPEKNAKPSQCWANCTQAILTAGQWQETGGCWETGGASHTTGRHMLNTTQSRGTAKAKGCNPWQQFFSENKFFNHSVGCSVEVRPWQHDYDLTTNLQLHLFMLCQHYFYLP